MGKKAKLLSKSIRNPKITFDRCVNFAIYTSEFQTAMRIVDLLAERVASIYKQPLIDRLRELELAALDELKVVFNMTVDGNLECYDVQNDANLKQMSKAMRGYRKYDFVDKDVANKLKLLAKYRNSSKILYFANAPIHIIAEFMRSKEYLDFMNESDKTGDAEMAEKARMIHLTLLKLFITRSAEFNDFLNSKELRNPKVYDQDILKAFNII